MFRASFELRMMMLSSTRVLNSPSLYLTPKAVGLIGLLTMNREYAMYAMAILSPSLRPSPINPTAFGVRYKDGEFSTRVEDNIIIRSSNEARNIGEAYLEKAIEHLKALQLLTPCTEYKESPARKIIIGREKL